MSVGAPLLDEPPPGQELCHFTTVVPGSSAMPGGEQVSINIFYLMHRYEGIQASCLKERAFLRKESACPLVKGSALA